MQADLKSKFKSPFLKNRTVGHCWWQNGGWTRYGEQDMVIE